MRKNEKGLPEFIFQCCYGYCSPSHAFDAASLLPIQLVVGLVEMELGLSLGGMGGWLFWCMIDGFWRVWSRRGKSMQLVLARWVI